MAERQRQMGEDGWRWNDCQVRQQEQSSDDEAPMKPKAGQRWLDPRTGCLSVWNGTEWVAVPAD
jgi:hypothetical protein